tara:strand:- start:19661 stop:20872 length:1212 start_codon:yes stop_codon:yes gene_type:complete
MTLFRESDRRIRTRKHGINDLIQGIDDVCAGSEIEETAIEYVCSAKHAADRLDVMGFNMQRVQAEFESGCLARVAEYRSWEEMSGDADWSGDISFYENLTFSAYVAALKEVISESKMQFARSRTLHVNPIVNHILDNEDTLLGYLGGDCRLLFRLACEVVAEDSEVIHDITDLVGSGYYGVDEAVCENALRDLVATHPENTPRIILTEGTTDIWILKAALAILYPHLSDFYHFFDFDVSRSRGGAGHLVSLVKAFSAAGVTNRIIALFDNDTAAHEAVRALKSITLPSNIAVLHYPDLELLRSYPTLGPGGLAQQDVNGLAGSIELFLGVDVLRERQGNLTPVQWKGYNEALGQYQGEVMHKAKLQEAFNEKVDRCTVDPDEVKSTDWSGLEAVLRKVLTAFD